MFELNLIFPQYFQSTTCIHLHWEGG